MHALGEERHRRRLHHGRDRAELLGRGLGRRRVQNHRLRCRRQDQDPAEDLGHLVEPEPEPRDDAEVPAAAADRPEQVRVRRLVHAEHLARGGHDVRGQERVDREPELPHEEADAAPERDAADPHGG